MIFNNYFMTSFTGLISCYQTTINKILIVRINMQPLDFIEISTNNSPNSSIIWLHGLGADGHDFEGLVKELRLPEKLGVRFLFPHAPIQPVSISGGHQMRSWFDILGLEQDSAQDEPGIRRAQQSIERLIDQTIQLGISSERIFLGGFSQGGALALHTAIRSPHKLAGAIGLSTYLPLADLATIEKHPVNVTTPIFMAHGNQDTVVPYRFAQVSYVHLQKLGYDVTFQEYPIGHTVSAQEIENISRWIQRQIL
jgi:phospholipase/carboxylesterase